MSDDKDPMTPADFRDLFPTARPARLQRVINDQAARIRLLEQQLKTAREEERERCAKMADEYPAMDHGSLAADPHHAAAQVAAELAAAIRSLGEKDGQK